MRATLPLMSNSRFGLMLDKLFSCFFFFLPFLFVFLYLLNVNLSDFNMVLAKDTKLQRCDVLGICKKT